MKRKVAALEKVDADLVSLRHKIRRDPRSYAQEFYDQWLVYSAQLEVFLSSPSTVSNDDTKKFHELIDLISHVADCYTDLTAPFPDHLKNLLSQHHAVLDLELRDKAIGALVLCRRKGIIDAPSLLTTLFPVLVASPSKSLRTLLFQKILSELREANAKARDHRLNRTVSTVLYNLVTSDRASQKPIWAVKLVRELWKRQVWTDTRPVDIMKEACLSESEKVAVSGCRFFLRADEDRQEADESSDDDRPDLRKMQHQGGVNKKTKKRAATLQRAVQRVRKKERKGHEPQNLNFSALHLLNDAQGFSERLFQKHLQNTKAKMALDSKLLVLQLVTRLVGLEKGHLIALYPWFLKYLKPSQLHVTSFLASLAQACHEHVSPDTIEPLIVRIANEFVSEGSASEVAAAGINAIREICVRQPLAMNEALLSDLVQYQRSKDKGVVMAAKSLQTLYRDVYPELLQKKYRGKEATMGLRSGEVKLKKFGEQDASGIEGIELLEKYKEEEREKKRAEKGHTEGAKPDKDGEVGGSDDDDDGDDGWEVASSDASDDNSDGWIAVSSDDDPDEPPAPPPAKRQRKDASEAPDLVPVDNARAEEEDAKAREEKNMSFLTSTILSQANLKKLRELQEQAAVDRAMGGDGTATKSSRRKKEMFARHIEDGVTAETLELASRIGQRATKEERVERAREGKPDREEHKSTQAIRKSKKEAAGKSSTNKDKARRKNFLMTMGKARAKNKRSLVETRRTLKAHIERSKSGGRRRNGR